MFAYTHAYGVFAARMWGTEVGLASFGPKKASVLVLVQYMVVKWEVELTVRNYLSVLVIICPYS